MANFFSRWLERRSLAIPSRELLTLFSSGPTESGVVVSPESALAVPAVFACCQVLSQDVARTPIRFKEQVKPDTFADATDHDLFEILGALANPEMTAYQFKAFMMWSLLTYGRAYAEIVRQEGRIVALWPLYSDQMHVDRTVGRVKRWTYTAGWNEFPDRREPQILTWLFDPSAPPILELTSPSPIQMCQEIIGSAIATQTYVGKFFSNNGRPAGILSTAGNIDPKTSERLRAYWTENYSGARNAFKVPVLEGGLTFTPISATNDDAQMNELLRTFNEQIAGIFRVPTWKIGDLSKANYSNMEAGENAYITSTLDPYFELWEEALRRDLLTVRQYGRYRITFDRASLVRNDVKALHDSLCQGIQNGIYSQNDVRKALGLNPIPDGDRYLVNSALQPVGAPKEVPNVS